MGDSGSGRRLYSQLTVTASMQEASASNNAAAPATNFSPNVKVGGKGGLSHSKSSCTVFRVVSSCLFSQRKRPASFSFTRESCAGSCGSRVGYRCAG